MLNAEDYNYQNWSRDKITLLYSVGRFKVVRHQVSRIIAEWEYWYVVLKL